jgi:hypothetical protein
MIKDFTSEEYKEISSVIVMPIEVEGYTGEYEGISVIKTLNSMIQNLRLLSVLSNILGIILYNTSLFHKILLLR